jgi:hypothetical protein
MEFTSRRYPKSLAPLRREPISLVLGTNKATRAQLRARWLPPTTAYATDATTPPRLEVTLAPLVFDMHN